jgi:hypothetical protein
MRFISVIYKYVLENNILPGLTLTTCLTDAIDMFWSTHFPNLERPHATYGHLDR